MDYRKLFNETFQGKKVFITGHTGFKGSWLLMWMHQAGAVIKGYSLAPENENDLFNLIGGNTLCESVIADILDAAKLAGEIQSFQPDYLFHLAAQPLVRKSYTDPIYTFQVNVNGTMHVLEALRGLTKKCLSIIVTTDKVYENLETGHAYREDDKLGGKDPYSASKAAAEIVTASYRHSFFADADYKLHQQSVATARAGNVIGGGDRAADRIIPDIIRALENGRPVEIRNPGSVRPWQHVLEPLAGYMLLASLMDRHPLSFNNSWNFGPHQADTKTVLELASEAISSWGEGSYETPQAQQAVHEAALLSLDISKSIKELGWIPRWDSSKAISSTLDWYKEQKQGNAFDLSLTQLNEYLDWK